MNVQPGENLQKLTSMSKTMNLNAGQGFLGYFFGSICICLLRARRTLEKQSCKQTENPFSLAHDTLPYISMQTDHDLFNLIMT